MEENAWWRDLTGLVGESDQGLVVIGIRSDTSPEEYRGIGLAIERWKAEYPHARHVWGLSDLLEGKHPRTPPIYIEVPFPTAGYEDCYEPVALAYVARGTPPKEAAEALFERLKEYHGRLNSFLDPDSYSFWNR